MEEFRLQLLGAYDLEHREHIEAVREALRDADIDAREVFRRIHSLKGAARAVDMPAVEEEAHRLEAMLAPFAEGAPPPAEGWREELRRGLEAIETLSAAGLAAARGEEGPAPVRVEPKPSTGQRSGTSAAPAAAGGRIHIEASRIGDIAASVQALTQALQEDRRRLRDLDRLRSLAQSLEGMWQEVRGPLLETRHAASVRQLDEGLRILRRDLSQSALSFGRRSWSVGSGMEDLRRAVEKASLAPARTVLAGMEPMIEELARERGLAVAFEASGLEVEADRQVLQALRDPVIHLLRNALSHGAEATGPAAREGAARPLNISLAISSRGRLLRIEVADDGPGPDEGRLRRAALERGLIGAAGAGLASQEEILALAFAPGLTTAGDVDRLSGRGMGLSVVAETLRRLGGSARLEHRHPRGARVVLEAPLSSARQTVCVVECQAGRFALPGHAIERLVRTPLGDLDQVEGHPMVRLPAGPQDEAAPAVPLVALGAMVGLPEGELPARYGVVTAVVIRHGERRLALAVDQVRDVQEAMVEAVRSDLIDPGLFSGAVVLEDETAILVLTPQALVDRWLSMERSLAAAGHGRRQLAAPSRPRTVLVVDDSITTRMLEKSILEAHGYRVRLAVDGLDALNQLRGDAGAIDLIVADVEMPRMDGFSLLQAVKADGGLSHLPVILMTSRDEAQDIRRGLDLGAGAYIPKQKFDQRELLATIGRLL